jgi:hypothetical protein
MTRRCLSLVVPLAVLLLLVSPSAASLVLSTVSFTPDAPLTPGGHQKAVATYAVIPTGSTTFSPGHSLQMQTNLEGASWTIQVTLDGRDAARQTATGSVAFVNGEILSYPTNRDVGMIVTVDGTVPADAAGPQAILTVKELDNGGNAVPGSDLTISQPVAGSTSPATMTAVPTLTPPVVTTVPPAKTPGPAALLVVIALAAAGLVLRRDLRKP